MSITVNNNKKYIVVAKAKYTIMLRGKQYKIGETVPTELTESEYEFYKNALDIESATETFTDTTTLHNGTKISMDYSAKDLSQSSQIISLLNNEIAELKSRIDELTNTRDSDSRPLTSEEKQSGIEKSKKLVYVETATETESETETATETEVKPAKRPYNKKDKE